MWTPKKPPLPEWAAGDIVPKTILYSLDGPAIFTANLGLLEFLFYKVDEDRNSQLFLITSTSRNIVDAIKARTLSLRGALSQAEYWLAEVNIDFSVKRFWEIKLAEIPSDLLPEPGFAVAPTQSSVADTIEQAIAFFSAKFTGKDLTESGMPFLRFKALVEGVYDSFRKIFPAPMIGDRSISRSLDFNLLQPKFGSLILGIEQPHIDVNDVKKYLSKEIDTDEISKSFVSDRDQFFARMNELVSQARKGEIRKSYAVEHFDTLDKVNDIVPTPSNELESVEFRTRQASVEPLQIEQAIGEKLRHAYRLAEKEPRTIVGAVVEINNESGTFLIKTRNERLVTCNLERRAYDNLKLSIGNKIRVRGRYTKRQRRDLLQITDFLG
jgi:hypothetical protein